MVCSCPSRWILIQYLLNKITEIELQYKVMSGLYIRPLIKYSASGGLERAVI